MSNFDQPERLVNGGGPREPSEYARRLIFRFQGGAFVFLLVGGIFTVIGSVLCTVFCWGVPADLRLDMQGVPMHATLTEKHLDRSTEVNGRNPTTMHFRYQVQGQSFEAETNTLDDALAGTPLGMDVNVDVLKSDPSVARLHGETRSMLGYWGLLMLLFPGLGLALAGTAVRKRGLAVKAYRYGQELPGQVVSFAPDRSVKINNRSPWKLQWEFTVDGKTYRGSLSSMNKGELEPFALQKNVTVLALPGNPRVNTLYVN